MKENIRNVKSNDKKDELSENNKYIRKIVEMYKFKRIIFFCLFCLYLFIYLFF